MEPVESCRFILPPPGEVTLEATRLFLTSLYWTLKHPLNFALVGDGSSQSVIYSIMADKAYIPQLSEDVRTFFPSSTLESHRFRPGDPTPQSQIFFKPSPGNALLRRFSSFTPDPWDILIQSFSRLGGGESAFLSVCIHRDDTMIEFFKDQHWKRIGLNSRPGELCQDHSLSDKALEFCQKCNKPLWFCRLQFNIYAVADPSKQQELASDVKRYLNQFRSDSSTFVETDKAEEIDLVNLDELVGLVHFPLHSRDGNILRAPPVTEMAIASHSDKHRQPCPFCARSNLVGEMWCRFCGKPLNENESPQRSYMENINSADVLDWVEKCLANPEAALGAVDAMVQSDPAIEKEHFVHSARFFAYGQQALARLDDSNNEATDAVIALCEKSLTEYALARDATDATYEEEEEWEERVVVKPAGFFRKAQTEVRKVKRMVARNIMDYPAFDECLDLIAVVLEDARPGRVQELLAKTKLKYLLAAKRVKMLNIMQERMGREKSVQEDIRSLFETLIEAPFKVGSAIVASHSEVGGRTWIFCSLFQELEPFRADESQYPSSGLSAWRSPTGGGWSITPIKPLSDKRESG